MTHSDLLRAQLSRRLRTVFPAEWSRFTTLWLAFNAMYGGEPDRLERTRVKSTIRKRISEARAKRIQSQTDVAIERLLAIPPGSMLLGQWNPHFRRASQSLARVYHGRSKTSVSKLAAVAGILYQVRCNLLHGEKDPQVMRDRMLVRESVRILDILLPELEGNSLGT